MRYIRTLIISLVIHGLVVFLATLLNRETATQKETSLRVPVVVDLLESPELRRRPKQRTRAEIEKNFVRSAPPPPELRSDKKVDTKYASEAEQYVLEERKARNSGLTTNRSLSGTNTQKDIVEKPADHHSTAKNKLDFKPQSPLDRIQDELHNEAKNQASRGETKDEPHDELSATRQGGLGDITANLPNGAKPQQTSPDGSRPLDLPNFMGAEKGLSTVGEDLPDSIKFGDFTALNTDRHLYYTFYARIEEMIRNRWVGYAKAVVYGLETGTQMLTGRETWTTKLEVVLDEKGNFERAILEESSGIRALDSAPVQAFRDARQFPNPPAEMVKDDGKIRIHYSFHVDVGARVAKGE